MGLIIEYRKLEIERLRLKTMLMESLCDNFHKTVISETILIGSMETAFRNVNLLFFELFGWFRYSSYEKFIQSLN